MQDPWKVTADWGQINNYKNTTGVRWYFFHTSNCTGASTSADRPWIPVEAPPWVEPAPRAPDWAVLLIALGSLMVFGSIVIQLILWG